MIIVSLLNLREDAEGMILTNKSLDWDNVVSWSTEEEDGNGAFSSRLKTSKLARCHQHAKTANLARSSSRARFKLTVQVMVYGFPTGTLSNNPGLWMEFPVGSPTGGV